MLSSQADGTTHTRMTLQCFLSVPVRVSICSPNSLSSCANNTPLGIGRRFALTEGICYLARVLRDWKVVILPEGEDTREQWSDRVLRGYTVMNFGIGKVPIRLVRRHQ